MRLRLLPLPALILLSAIACGGGEGGVSPGGGLPPVPPVVTVVAVSPALATIELGTTATMTAEIRDQFGALIGGKAPAWTSSAPAVATVNATSGLITGVAVGTATITATVDGKTGTATASVFPPPVKAIVLGALPAAIVAGQSFTLTAAPKDRNGGDLAGRVVTWTSSASRVATVDPNGKITTLSAGAVTITATSEGVVATTPVVVAAPAGTALASISAITPATLSPGVTATITGTNFGTAPGNNVVWIAGVPAVVNSASATRLTFTVPLSGIACQSTQPVNVEVTTLAGTAGAKQTLVVATQRTLAVGASLLVTTSASPTTAGNVGCNELPASGTYLVSVFNATKNLAQSARFELTGSSGGVLADRIPGIPAVRPTLIPAPVPSGTSPVDPAVAAAVREHLRRLEADARLRRQLGPPGRYARPSRVSQSLIGPAGPLSSSALQAPIPLTVGGVATVKFNYNTCTTNGSPTITARVVYVGPHALVLEDNASPLAGKVDADLIAMAVDYETVSWPILLKFGNPLAFDDSLSRVGKVVMLFTPRVNQAGSNLLGFVQSCDFYHPVGNVSGSNETEIFYARTVTDTNAASTSLNGRQTWKRFMPGTLIHESKHLIAQAERAETPVLVTDDEETWLEEATAQLASEMYGRAIHGNSWRSNAAYFGTLDCELRPTTPSCGGGVYVMGNHFAFLTDFLENVETKTILSGTDDNDIYGSSWMFTRWLVDTYGGTDEAALLHRIVTNYNVFGVDNVTNVTGKTWPELLSQFSLMLAADDLPNVAPPFTEQSWNLPGVFKGYSTDIASRPPASPLVPRTAAFGSFTTSTITLQGGGVMLMRVGGATGGSTQLFDLHQPGGAALSTNSNIGIAILRIQ